jgi:NAD(P)-dependent dehydrogenase (short-subunit alcohol dehydrogenase family)
MRFDNQSAVVVGGGSGIGFAVAQALYVKGATVTIVGRNQTRLENARLKIDAAGERIRAVPGDITVQSDRARIFESVPSLDYLVITAADLPYMPFRDFTENAAWKAVESKILGPFFTCQQAAARLQPTGSITRLSGIAAYRPGIGGSMTATVNGALESMVRALAIELAPIRVNVVSPGWVDTPIWERIMSAEKRAKTLEELASRLPIRRLGSADEVAAAILSVMTNGFITGSLIHVDGGQRLV